MLNTLESYIGPSPDSTEGVCAKFVIDDTAVPFILSNITKVGGQYTFSFWLRSDVAGSLMACGETYSATTEWVKHKTTFTAISKELSIVFGTVGAYYIYHPKLEIGNMATDWTPAPEDMATGEDLNATNNNLQSIHETLAELTIESDAIKASVANVESSVNSMTNELEVTRSEVASMKLESDALIVELQKLNDDGAKKVITTTGTFDEDGFTIDKSDSTTKTQVTPDGMTVYKKDTGGDQEEVLAATSEGVDATNLHAKTFLVIGGRSRFENFGTDRTGCFWIGG